MPHSRKASLVLDESRQLGAGAGLGVGDEAGGVNQWDGPGGTARSARGGGARSGAGCRPPRRGLPAGGMYDGLPKR